MKVFYKNRNRNVAIDGYVENIDGGLFEMRETMQISLVCPDPYWQGLNETEAKTSMMPSLFRFPFSIAAAGIPVSMIYENPVCTADNTGDVPVGFTAQIRVSTEEQPELTITTQTIHFEDMLKYQFDIFDSVSFEPESNTLNVFVNDTKVDASAYSAGYLIDSGGNTPYLKFNEALGLGSELKTIIYAAGGRAITDLQCLTDSAKAYCEQSIKSEVPALEAVEEGDDKRQNDIFSLSRSGQNAIADRKQSGCIFPGFQYNRQHGISG